MLWYDFQVSRDHLVLKADQERQLQVIKETKADLDHLEMMDYQAWKAHMVL